MSTRVKNLIVEMDKIKKYYHDITGYDLDITICLIYEKGEIIYNATYYSDFEAPRYNDYPFFTVKGETPEQALENLYAALKKDMQQLERYKLKVKETSERVFEFLCQIAKVEDKEKTRQLMMKTIENDVVRYMNTEKDYVIQQLVEDIAQSYLGR